jgi:peptide chain release factor subunit 1
VWPAQISLVSKMLTDEFGTAASIKSRITRYVSAWCLQRGRVIAWVTCRQSVLSAITSAQQKLKNYSTCPPNGLAIFVGEITTEEGKKKKVAIDLEPFRPINRSCYLCDSRFHTEALKELLEDDETFGFIVMDGSGTLYGRVKGSTREVLHRFSVDLPKKHGRGGQSALRFARLRLEKRHHYLCKVAETAVMQFITSDRPNVTGLILAGSAEFKNDLQKSDMLDPRLKDVIVSVVDVAYGGEVGFNQAIDLAADSMANVRLVAEQRVLGRFIDEIDKDTGKFCFGARDTMTALEMSCVETLVLWEDLALERYELRDPTSGATTVMILTPEEAEDRSRFRDPVTGVHLEVCVTRLFIS